MTETNTPQTSGYGFGAALDVPFDELVARIPHDGSRPLAADRAVMEHLFALRTAAYSAAHLRISASGLRAEEVAERIIESLGHRLTTID